MKKISKNTMISIRIDEVTLAKLKSLAAAQHLPYQTFLKVMIRKTLELNDSKKSF